MCLVTAVDLSLMRGTWLLDPGDWLTGKAGSKRESPHLFRMVAVVTAVVTAVLIADDIVGRAGKSRVLGPIFPFLRTRDR